jgi:hypothetical protein
VSPVDHFEAFEAYTLINGEWENMPNKNNPTAMILKEHMLSVIDEHIARVVKDAGGINGFVLSSLSLDALVKVRAFVLTFPPMAIPFVMARDVKGGDTKNLVGGDDKSVTINGDNAKVVIAEPKDNASVTVNT